MAGRGPDEGRRKLPGSAPGSTAPGTEIAAVERREARLRRHGGDAPRQACRAASPAVQEAWQASAFLGAPLPQEGRRLTRRSAQREGGMEYGVPGAANNMGGAALANAPPSFRGASVSQRTRNPEI